MTPLGPLTNKSLKSVKRRYSKSSIDIESSSGTLRPKGPRSSQARQSSLFNAEIPRSPVHGSSKHFILLIEKYFEIA